MRVAPVTGRSVRLLLAAVALAASGLAACSDEEADVDPVPPPLRRIEEAAEDAYDTALAQDFAAVSADAAVLDQAWQGYRAKALSDGVAASDAEALDTAIAELHGVETQTDPVIVARAANAVSAPLDEMFAIYHPIVPGEVLALDYLGREIQLDGLESDLISAQSDVDLNSATWASLRAPVLSAGGSAEASNFDASITAERDAIATGDTQGLVTRAQEQLDLVDLIEAVFQRHAAAQDPPD